MGIVRVGNRYLSGALTALLFLTAIGSIAAGRSPDQVADAIERIVDQTNNSVGRKVDDYQRFLERRPTAAVAEAEADSAVSLVAADVDDALSEVEDLRQLHPDDEEVAAKADAAREEIPVAAGEAIGAIMAALSEYQPPYDPEPSSYIPPTTTTSPPSAGQPTTTVTTKPPHPKATTTTAPTTTVPTTTVPTTVPTTTVLAVTVPTSTTSPSTSRSSNSRPAPAKPLSNPPSTTTSTSTTSTTLILALPATPIPPPSRPGPPSTATAPATPTPPGLEPEEATEPDPRRFGDRAAVLAAVRRAEAATTEWILTTADQPGSTTPRRLSSVFTAVQTSLPREIGEPMADLLIVFKALLAAVSSGLRVVGLPWLAFTAVAVGLDRWRRRQEDPVPA